MFISVKRHEREKQELIENGNRLSDALLKHLPDGVFLLDKNDRIMPQVSDAMSKLFRREDFSNLSFEKLLAPLVNAKTLSLVRGTIADLLSKPQRDWDPNKNPLQDIEVRLRNPDASLDNARYSFDFRPVYYDEPAWLVRVVDISAHTQTSRELEELRATSHLQGELLRGVLQMGGARFGAFLQRTDASMKTINAVLKKSAREEDSFRHKLEETLEEVDRVRRDAAAFKLTGLENASRSFEDALHDLRSRTSLSGGDFLPLAVKLDQLYGQFAAIRALATQSGSARDAGSSTTAPMTDKGTQIIEAPKFDAAQFAPSKQAAVMVAGAHRAATAGSLDNTLQALTDHVAAEHGKAVALDITGLQLVPAAYQSAIKNIAIQLIRNAVMHGIEPAELRQRAGKPADGTLRLDFKLLDDQSCEFLFEDDGCGIDPKTVRHTAVSRGVIAADAASRLRDREAIKLIFKSGYSTLPTDSGDSAHGNGMSLVRRYVHEAGGKIALASLLGHETRFKVTLPPPPPDVQAAS